MIDMMQGVASGRSLDTHWKRIADLRLRAKVLIFLTENGIRDVEQLAATVERMHTRQYEVANRTKEIDRRKEKLTEHLSNVDIRKQHGTLYKKYKGLDPKKRAAFREKHAEAIEQYLAAGKYLQEHLNGRTVIPEKEWRAELKRLTAERYALVEEYYKLKDDVKNVETLRRSAMNIMSQEAPEQTLRRSQDLSL